MWNSLRSLLAGQWSGTAATPLPSPVTITGMRFPADGSKPHLLPLTTTTHGVSIGVGCCNGLYVVFFSWDLDSLPENGNFPRGVYGRERAFAGDAFVVKLKGDEIGSDLGEDGWAAWDDVPAEILSLPVMRM